jgi:nucleotide-binding universal stress UspA family protein
MKRILVATDGSPGGDRAIDAAAELAKALEASLIILTVQQEPSPEAVRAYKEIEHVAETEVAAILARGLIVSACERAKLFGTSDVHHQIETGDPTEMILAVAKQRQADMIVVGKRGRGTLAGLLLGSVSQKLVTLATCRVLVVP